MTNFTQDRDTGDENDAVMFVEPYPFTHEPPLSAAQGILLGLLLGAGLWSLIILGVLHWFGR